MYKIRQCIRPNCSFRFQVREEADLINYCPKCGSPTRIVELAAPVENIDHSHTAVPKPDISLMFDNIRSSFNVGSMIRTADGAGVQHLYFAGITPTPDNPKIRKTSLGSETAVPWTQTWNIFQSCSELKNSGYRLWAFEESQKAVSINECIHEPAEEPILIIMGNEVYGVDGEVLKICDRVFWIPMLGMKRSLNVAVAFGIAIYTIRFAFSLQK
jgi:23S rRNA (guanosine2251-2'-O)-methyltransferase